MQIWERSRDSNTDERKCHGEGWRLVSAPGKRVRCRLGMLAELVGHGSGGRQNPGNALRIKNELQQTTCLARPSDTVSGLGIFKKLLILR